MYMVYICFYIQGLHILTDTHNGFGGFTGALLQELEDDLAGKSLLVSGLSPPNYGQTVSVTS